MHYLICMHVIGMGDTSTKISITILEVLDTYIGIEYFSKKIGISIPVIMC